MQGTKCILHAIQNYITQIYRKWEKWTQRIENHKQNPNIDDESKIVVHNRKLNINVQRKNPLNDIEFDVWKRHAYTHTYTYTNGIQFSIAIRNNSLTKDFRMAHPLLTKEIMVKRMSLRIFSVLGCMANAWKLYFCEKQFILMCMRCSATLKVVKLDAYARWKWMFRYFGGERAREMEIVDGFCVTTTKYPIHSFHQCHTATQYESSAWKTYIL